MNYINRINNEYLFDVIKIYIYKLIFSLSNDYDKFLDFNFKKYGIILRNSRRTWNEKIIDNSCVFYLFPSFEEQKLYNNYLKEYEELKHKIKEINNTDFEMLYNNYYNKDLGLDIFLHISINIMLHKLEYMEYEDNKDEYINYYNIAQIILKQNKKYINNEIIEKFKKINKKSYEILFYGFRYCALSINNFLYNIFYILTKIRE